MYIDPRAAPRGGARRAGGDAEAVRADLAEELVDHECEDLRGESKRSSAAPVPRSTGGVCSPPPRPSRARFVSKGVWRIRSSAPVMP